MEASEGEGRLSLPLIASAKVHKTSEIENQVDPDSFFY
jgi:hypothetical protein